ncbi:MAG: lactate racemase domain-containing protein [Candidatus Poribacteria bacterium]|nr:lactate racemase domain-containing protein [Candidatus Poribacteria bacterium]
MATFQVPWTDGQMSLNVPDQNIAAVVASPDLPRLGEPLELVKRAIEKPIGGPPLKEAVKPTDRVAFLITDTMDTLMGPPHNIGPYLLDELNAAGVADGQITVVHAAGMHGHGRAVQKLGEGWLHRVRYLEHHPHKAEDLAFVGTTSMGTPVWVNKAVAEADYVFGVGGCSPSLFGWHGGAGIILPGASGRDTIRHNHTYILMNRPISGWGPDNPQREDVQNAGDLAGFNMKIDFTANTVFAGYHRAEWPTAVKYCQEHTMTPVEPADIYIMGVGGSPNLGCLYMKIETAEQVIRENGIVILVCSAHEQPDVSDWSEARALQQTVDSTNAWMENTGTLNIRGDAGELDLLARFRLMQLPLPRLAQILTRREGEPRSTCMSWSHRRAIERGRTFIVTEMAEAQAYSYGFAYVTRSFDDALQKASQEVGRDARIIVNAPLSGTPLPPQNRVSPRTDAETEV